MDAITLTKHRRDREVLVEQRLLARFLQTESVPKSRIDC